MLHSVSQSRIWKVLHRDLLTGIVTWLIIAGVCAMLANVIAASL
jgi:hypothetical protein